MSRYLAADAVEWLCDHCNLTDPRRTVRASNDKALEAAKARHLSMRHNIRGRYARSTKDVVRYTTSSLKPTQLASIRRLVGRNDSGFDSAAAAANLADLLSRRHFELRERAV